MVLVLSRLTSSAILSLAQAMILYSFKHLILVSLPTPILPISVLMLVTALMKVAHAAILGSDAQTQAVKFLVS